MADEMNSSVKTDQNALMGGIRRLYDWVLSWADTPYAMPALFILAFAEASFFPIPPDVLLIAMCMGASDRSLVFAGACTIASVLGGLAGYAICAFAWSNRSASSRTTAGS